jgi:hypothetical protein
LPWEHESVSPRGQVIADEDLQAKARDEPIEDRQGGDSV